jgi:hypothetical protein
MFLKVKVARRLHAVVVVVAAAAAAVKKRINLL